MFITGAIVQHLDSVSRIWKRRSNVIRKIDLCDQCFRCVDWNASRIIPLIHVLRKLRAHYAVT